MSAVIWLFRILLSIHLQIDTIACHLDACSTVLISVLCISLIWLDLINTWLLRFLLGLLTWSAMRDLSLSLRHNQDSLKTAALLCCKMELRLVKGLNANLLVHQFNCIQGRFPWTGRTCTFLEHFIEVHRCRLDLLASIKLLASAPWLWPILCIHILFEQVILLARLIEVFIWGTHLIYVYKFDAVHILCSSDYRATQWLIKNLMPKWKLFTYPSLE